ncbi:hypothetical protein VCR31J2_1350039 [Vibrio coralliirubri]|uniref:Uncharacterized protein n=1 Tax=Vibrio coralliirubri TaxID=1516159 RepID=A0AA86WPS3_9VIBR|nr:hypothetical protein VCR31J2_1350039 [Vibrio coralliirubri]
MSRPHGDEWKVTEEVFTSFPIATKERNRESLLAIGDSRYFVPQFWNDGEFGSHNLVANIASCW